MLEKPDLSEATLVVCLYDAYAIRAERLTFLPIGYDARSWVYAAATTDGDRTFLKVRKLPIYAAALSVPQHLQKLGITEVVAPLPSRSGALWTPIGDYGLILYPFIDGRNCSQTERSGATHIEFGALLARIHATLLPSPLLAQMKRESFAPAWSQVVETLQAVANSSRFADEIGEEFANQWQARSREIQTLMETAQRLGQMAKSRSPELVLCHADIHTHNQLIDHQGRIHIVDWDGVILAPRERDLMFIIGNDYQERQRSEAESCFFAGYGDIDLDPVAVAYYRYEWVIQELGDCGERILLATDTPMRTRQAALQDFLALFEADDVVAAAYRSALSLDI